MGACLTTQTLDKTAQQCSAPHILDWSTAWSGRLASPNENEQSQNNTQAHKTKQAHNLDRAICQPFALRKNDISHRLRMQLAANTLPCISLPYAEELIQELQGLTPYLRSFSHMLVLGIGGSALGALALQKAFLPEQDRPNHQGPHLWIADNVDPESINAFLEGLNPQETIVVTISKSGDTIETLAQYFIFRQWLQNALGESWYTHALFITDAQKGFLREEAQRYAIRSLTVPDNLGGRYSVLSAVGLVPALFMDIDWQALLAGAMEMGRDLADKAKNMKAEALTGHPAWELAVWNRTLMEQGYGQLIFFSYAPKWASFGPWFAQLWAESLGKEGKGSMPLPAVGVTDQHSTQQMFLDGPRDKACLCLISSAHIAQNQGPAFPDALPENWHFLQNKHFGALLEAESLSTRMAMHKANIPLITLDMAELSPHAAGRLIMLLELTTIFTGWLLDIDPFNQPAVELGKRLANAQLGAQGYSKEEASLAAFMARPPHIQEF